MVYFYIITAFVFLHIICDFNYFLRTIFTVITSRFCENKCSLDDVTTIYGLCTLQDCDVFFRSIRTARLVREIDFARYHFYERVGIYKRSIELGIKSLQGSTMTVDFEPLPIFARYKINTKLIYWDERSLFFEHEVITMHDGRVRHLLISRQYAIGSTIETTEALLKGLPGSIKRPKCPPHIERWLRSMQKSSVKLRNKQ
ncbi:protein THEM6-like [Pieris rapae]|uniref:protein THEM6-like n=1 Tax=Pieris rapae TaxID=64459 RepID=UPI001E27FDF9|nr:protein THEM6-like [Pieris rapae]